MLNSIRKTSFKAAVKSFRKLFLISLVLFIPIFLFIILYKPMNTLDSNGVKSLNRAFVSLRIIGGPFAETVVSGQYSAYLGMLQGPTVEEVERVNYAAAIKLEDKPEEMLVAIDVDNSFPLRTTLIEFAMNRGWNLYYYGMFCKSDEINKYKDSYLIYNGYSYHDLVERSLSPVFVINGGFPVLRLLSAAFGLALIVLGIARMIKAGKGDYYEKLEEDLRAAQYAEDDFTKELENAGCCDAKNCIMIGKKLTILDIYGIKPRAILNENIETFKTCTKHQGFAPVFVVQYKVKGEEKPLKLKIKSEYHWINAMTDYYRYSYPAIKIEFSTKKRR